MKRRQPVWRARGGAAVPRFPLFRVLAAVGGAYTWATVAPPDAGLPAAGATPGTLGCDPAPAPVSVIARGAPAG